MLARTFLRICALEALRPSSRLDADGPWQTIAGKYVYDTLLDPIDDLQSDSARHVVAIYTDEDNLDKIAQHGPQFYKSTVDLVIEISVMMAEGEGDDYIVGVPTTDAELEASLDLLEQQIFWLLHFGPTGILFRKIAKLPASDWHSLPERSTEEKQRVAARTIRAKFQLHEICIVAAPTEAPTGLDRLPPYLAGIATALGASTYLRKITEGLAAGAPQSPVPDRLTGVSITTDPKNTDQAPDADTDIKASADNLQT